MEEAKSTCKESQQKFEAWERELAAISTSSDNDKALPDDISAPLPFSLEETEMLPPVDKTLKEKVQQISTLDDKHGITDCRACAPELCAIETSNRNEGSELSRPKTPDGISFGVSAPTGSSPVTPSQLGGYSSSASTPSTPREDSSSGSPSPIPDDAGKLSNKDKPRVTLGKDLSLMMQALNSLQSPEEKIAALCKKYADLLDQQKLLQKQLKISQRKQAQSLKEKEQLQAETAKTLNARSKLESLCRELQKRNKAMKEEQNKKAREEVSRRQVMASEFQTTLNRIQSQMKTAVDGSNKLQFENERIGGKLKEIVDKYQGRETALENLVKQHDRQEQIVSAQLKKTLLEHQEQKDKSEVEKQKLLEQIVERTVLYEAKVKQEKELRTQLQYYSEKFEDFQSTLEKSNEIFASFRSEMDKMSKKLKQAEKHRATIQKKWEDSTKALADTADYTQQLESKQARLEKLSRALQNERNELAQRLRNYEGNSIKKPKEGSKRKKSREEHNKKELSTVNQTKSSKQAVEKKNEINSKKNEEVECKEKIDDTPTEKILVDDKGKASEVESSKENEDPVDLGSKDFLQNGGFKPSSEEIVRHGADEGLTEVEAL